MSKNRWLLPNGIDEVVADDARRLESLRRSLLDLFDAWGYNLIFPPIIEFTDSLLTGLGERLDLQTFKFSDQQSGESLGLRADISPQAARIDAHSMGFQGANRLCYAGTIVRSNPTGAFENRAPFQVGAELFGIEEIDADLEIISLMLTSLQSICARELSLEVSHQAVRIWLQQLASSAALDFDLLCTLLSAKRLPELDAYLDSVDVDSATAAKLQALPRIMGDASVLETAKKLFAQDGLILDAIAEMQLLAERIGDQYPEVNLFFNLSEVQFSDYHSGLTFAAYCEQQNVAVKIANGGRYNQVGEAFGRSRAATGFSADLKVLVRLFDAQVNSKKIYAQVPSEKSKQLSKDFWLNVERLREQGYQVQLGYSSERNYLSEYGCDQQLTEIKGEWQLVDID